MTIAVQTPFASFLASGSATFAYAFKVNAAADLIVKVNGVTQLSSLYSVTGVGLSAGSIVFISAPTAGAIVTIQRKALLQRTTDYQINGDLLAGTVNPDFDAIWMVLQELQSNGAYSSLRVQDGETLTALAAAASRLGKMPVFNASTGDAELSTFTFTQVASAVAAAYGTGSTADAITYLPTSGPTLTVQAELRNVDTYLPHVKTQKPAAYSLPRFMRTLESYRTDLRPAINIVGFGSSVGVGATLPTPSTQAPVAYFAIKLKAVLDKGNLFNLVTYNDSVNGSTVSESFAVLTTATGTHTPKICVLAYGMNDSAPAIFNSGQTYPAVYISIMRFVAQARAAGSDVVLMTTPHHKISGYTFAMPGGISQVYPTSVAAPVAAEAMIPPASTSAITGDFVGDGSSISVSHRSLRVNQAMRQAATDAGVPLIDVERYWFKAVATYGEAALFDVGELVHPNLLGHQQSYWLAMDEFIESLGRQTAQEGQEPRLNGLVGVNKDSPTAVLDIDIPYPNMTAAPLQVSARVGLADGSGIKASGLVWKVDPANGDLVGYGVNPVTNAVTETFRHHTEMVSGGVAYNATTETGYATLVVKKTGGQVGASGTVTVVAVPDNSYGTVWINGYQSGVGRKRIRVEWVSVSGAITLGTIDAVGAGVFTGPTTSGLNIQVTCFVAGTSLNYELVSNSGI